MARNFLFSVIGCSRCSCSSNLVPTGDSPSRCYGCRLKWIGRKVFEYIYKSPHNYNSDNDQLGAHSYFEQGINKNMLKQAQVENIFFSLTKRLNYDIFSFFQIYGYVAVWLTNLEYHRTFTEYEDSLTFKLFLFQFINYYSNLIYIAFFKVEKIIFNTKYLISLFLKL